MPFNKKPPLFNGTLTSNEFVKVRSCESQKITLCLKKLLESQAVQDGSILGSARA